MTSSQIHSLQSNSHLDESQERFIMAELEGEIRLLQLTIKTIEAFMSTGIFNNMPRRNHSLEIALNTLNELLKSYESKSYEQ